MLRREPVDVILLDMNFSAGINTGNEGFYWLQEIHRNYPEIKVVLFHRLRRYRSGGTGHARRRRGLHGQAVDNDRLVAALRNAY